MQQQETEQSRQSGLVAVAYVRMSLDKNGEQLGIERQEAEIRALAEREGLILSHVYADNSISATNGARRWAYERLRRDAAQRRFDIVYCWATDRLYRKLTDLEQLVAEFEAAEVTVRTVKSGTVDLSTADGRLHARLLGAVAQHEGEKRAERLRSRNKQRTQQERLITTGARPFGLLRLGPCKYEPHVTEAPALIEVFRRFDNGASLLSLAKWLNSEGFTGTMGGKFTAEKVKTILRNEIYAGLITSNGVVIGENNSNTKLVDRSLYESVQTRLNGSTIKRGRPQVTLLGGMGLLKCSHCAELGQNPNLTHNYKRVGGGNRELFYQCQSRHVSRNVTETDAVILGLLDNYLHKYRAELVAAAKRSTDFSSLAARNKEAVSLEKKLETLAVMWASNKLSDDAYAAATRAAEQRLTELRALTLNTGRLSTNESSGSSLPDDMEHTYKIVNGEVMLMFSPLTVQRAVIAELIESVTISKGQELSAIVPKWKQQPA